MITARFLFTGALILPTIAFSSVLTTQQKKLS